MHCPSCKSPMIVKNGHGARGERFLCKGCGLTFYKDGPADLKSELEMRQATRERKQSKTAHETLLRNFEKLQKELAHLKCLHDVSSHKIPFVEPTSRSVSTAVTMWSDWHLEEEVRSSAINGLNNFNLEEAKKRVEYLANRIVKFLRMYRRDTEIDRLVICLGGDFITGNIHEENMENALLRPMDAIMYAEELIAGAIEFIQAHVQHLKLTICCVPGNHSRITDKMRFSTEMGNSLEYYMYHHLAKYFHDNKDIEFVISSSPLLYLKIYGMNIRMMHGHQIRYSGGVGGLLIPARRKVSEWDKAITADLNLIGHWHQEQKFGKIVTNGSLIGYNSFALSGGFEYEPPKQQFFLLNGNKKAMTIYSPVLL